MSDLLAALFKLMLYLFEGYCLQLLFRAFAEPRLPNWRWSNSLVGIVWIATRISCGVLLQATDGISLIEKLLFQAIALAVFCICWYQGNSLLNVFLAIQFMALRELAFFAGYSLLYVSGCFIDLFAKGMSTGTLSERGFFTAVDITMIVFMLIMEIVQGALLYFSIQKLVKSYRHRERDRPKKEQLFYLLPAVAGVLVAVLIRLLLISVEDGTPVLLYHQYPALYLIIPMIAMVLLGAILFSFQLYQDMIGLQKERTEKVILENQITQMQHSMVEMEHLYDGIRSVKHDMKNHMAVLQLLLEKKFLSDSGEDEEVRHYFEGMYQSVEQLERKVRTGNAVSDAVIGSKFRYAEKEIDNIKLKASDFILTDAVRVGAYDIGIILNNGLDNAIEACLKMRQKQPDAEVYITIKSFRKKNLYFIEIENSFDDVLQLDKESGYPVSTKEDNEIHGIGLRNIKNCAKKYAGDMDCIVEDKKFTLSIMLKG
ncbi:sensor histidine kinase [Desulfitobacterium chlororespirans]|uniref:GHKL domain-containing protein n=1 Tax=Desulfitobacterium chlororespirans DSM 11544 TaxID=1121395 RepID=A0A1M7UM81_9FIRM|nr:sensor histidine kinase [Desulfitobacterium chlororespirans]SHN84005.1 GHKL domain-containing protein [Desulfitobacterium chlororespirans DSM 11544]